jgi:hypothetical protein
MDIKHLNQIQLARRWSISPRTLERWRWLRQGPDYLKLGGRIVYRVEDVEAFEAAGRRFIATRSRDVTEARAPSRERP